MGRYVMVVQSKAKDGREEDYNRWYDDTHLREMLDLPGMTGARRFEFVQALAGADGLPHLVIYEIEADDVASVVRAMHERPTTPSDALDAPASVLWFYEQRG